MAEMERNVGEVGATTAVILDQLEEALVALQLEGPGTDEKEAVARNVICLNANDGELFRKAAEEGRISAVKFFLEAPDRFELTPRERMMCSNDEAMDCEGMTPLHFASLKGHTDVVKCFISSGASLDEPSCYKGTPLFLASQGGHFDTVKILIEHNADVRLAYCEGKPFDTCAVEAAVKGEFIDVVKVLLSAGAPSFYALAEAAERGYMDIVLLLLDLVSNPAGNQKCVIDAALVAAAKGGHFFISQLLIDAGASPAYRDEGKMLALEYATLNGHIEIVNLLLELGSHFNNEDGEGDGTPLHYAVRGGHISIVTLLLERNATVDEKDWCGFTPLDLAVSEGCREIALLLISRSASLNTSLLLENALHSYNGKFLAVLALLKMGETSVKESTPLHMACERGHLDIVCLLLRRIPEMNARNSLNSVDEASEIVHQRHALVNTTNSDNETPLHLTEQLNIQELLLLNGADPHIPDANGCTPLHKVKNAECARLLLQQNILVDARDKMGNTPLHYSYWNGLATVAKLLIEHGALVSAKNKQGKKPGPLYNSFGVYHEIDHLLFSSTDSTVTFDNSSTSDDISGFY